jgi:hypothetical protein
LVVYQLKNTSAGDLATTLQQVFTGGGQVKAEGDVRVAAEPMTNSLILNVAPADKAKVEKLIQSLDVQRPRLDDALQAVTIPLVNVAPDQELEKVLRLIFQSGGGNFALDSHRRAVVLLAEAPAREKAQRLLIALEDLQRTRAQKSADGEKNAELRTRIVWLVSGFKGDIPASSAFPPDLADVAAELAKMGIEKPRLVSQVLMNTAVATPFEIIGTAQLGGPCRLNVGGLLTDKAGVMGLAIRLNVYPDGESPQGGKVQPKPAPLCSLQTNITTHLGHAVVLGVTPTVGITSIFVIQILSPEEPRKRQ